jgi:hypothetical protein
MDWKVKLIGEKICSFLPFGYKLASTARNKLVNTEVDCLERIDKGLDNLAMIRKLTRFDPENKRILEVGTGRHGIDCLILYVLGAEAIYTFDHVLHLEKDIMASAIEPLRGRLDEISVKFEVDKGEMSERIEKIVTDGSLEDMLSSCNTKYFKYPIHEAGLKPESIDLFFSESVLQRIPVDHLKQIIAALSELLSSAGISFHRIDCKDINSQDRFYDSGLWALHYLKYSDFVWNLICSEKFNSQNRLREFEFIDLLENAGLKSLYVESLRKKEDLERLRDFPLSKRFKEMPLEEVAVRCSKIVSTKSYVTDVKRKIADDDWTRWYNH